MAKPTKKPVAKKKAVVKKPATKLSKKVVRKIAGKITKAKAVSVKAKPKAKKPTVNWKKATAYVGLKEIDAIPMTRGEYNLFRGWNIPAEENSKDKGYIVRYPDGYISWSPEKQFEEAYAESGNLSFSAAVHLMKKGHKLARAGWNGKGMWVIYVPGTKKAELREGTPYAKHLKRKTVEILPHFDMWTINAKGRRAMLPGWLASQSDIDATDWCVVK